MESVKSFVRIIGITTAAIIGISIGIAVVAGVDEAFGNPVDGLLRATRIFPVTYDFSGNKIYHITGTPVESTAAYYATTVCRSKGVASFNPERRGFAFVCNKE